MLNLDFIHGMEDFKEDPKETSPKYLGSTDVVKLTVECVDATGSARKYCPVFCDVFEDKSRKFTAYLTDAVKDVDQYVDLIDILMTAKETDSVDIYIDSPGGLIAAGGLIASAVDYSRAKVRTIARGLCASAAALIHSAAKPGNACVTPFAMMLYHMSSHGDVGTSTIVEARAHNQVKYVNETLLNKALADGHITEEEFARIQTGEDIIISGEEWLRRTSQGVKSE
jgi:ATP-dependent protease ClpP protease subunit